MAAKIKSSHLIFGFILLVGLSYKFILPITPHDSVSSLVQPVYYLFLILVCSFTLLVIGNLSITRTEYKFTLLIFLYYTLIFFSSWANLTEDQSNFSFVVILRFLLIFFVCFSGMVFGKLVRENESLRRYCVKAFLLFTIALFLRGVITIDTAEFFYKRPFTLHNSLLTLIFLFFLSHVRRGLLEVTILFLIGFMFLSSGSRTVLVSALFIALVYFIMTSKGKGKAFSWLFSIVILSFLAYALFNFADNLGRFSKILLISEDSRILVWTSVLADISKDNFSWLLGRGFLSDLYVLYNDNQSVIVNTPHNTYLYLFYYTGVLGLLLGISIMLYAFINVQLIFKIYLVIGVVFMFFNDSLFFPHSFSYLVDYWFYFLFVSYFWKKAN